MHATIGIIVTLLAVPLIAGDAGSDLNQLMKDFWHFRMRNNPTFSTFIGQYRNNDLMMSYDIAGFPIKKTRAIEFMNRLRAIDETALDNTDRVNRDILNDSLTTFQEGSKWDMYSALSPVTFLGGIHVYDGPYMAASSTRGDFENYIARLHAVHKQVDEIKVSMRKAIEVNRTLHNVSMARVPEQIDAWIHNTPEESDYFNNFGTKLNESHIPETLRPDIRQRGRAAVIAYMAALKDLKSFIVSEYMPATRTEYGVHAWDPSHAYYRECIKWHLSFEMSPEEVHRRGRLEVARISGEMNKIMERLKFTGSVKEFFLSLQGDSRFYSNDTVELLTAYRDTVFKRIQPKLAAYFRDIPNIPIDIKASTSDGLGGGYSAATDDEAGTFEINLFRPMEVPKFEMMALSLHESIPGHHLQHSYSMRTHLPDFRKHTILSFNVVPNWFPFYSAYEEGWALYCEYLGEGMGLYKDEYEMMGRYSYEILRASRLVVDTGIHYYGWSRDKAIEYLTNHTALQEGGAANEIDRYITWPGQACAYKIGEMKIKDLRSKAESELGSLFDIRDFHYVILKNGAMPMAVLETTVLDWISEQKAMAATHAATAHGQTTGCVAGMLVDQTTASHSAAGACVYKCSRAHGTGVFVLLLLLSTFHGVC